MVASAARRGARAPGVARAAVVLAVGCAAVLAAGPGAPLAHAEAPAIEDQLATLAMLEDTRCPDARQVVAYLQDGFPAEVRQRAALALARLQDSTAVEHLADRLFRDDVAGVRREAAFALGQIGHQSAYTALSKALERDPDFEVRALSLEALGKLGDRRASGLCLRALVDPEARLRREAAIALWRLADSNAVSPTLKALDDSDAETRALVAWALEKTVRPGMIVPEVARLATDNSWQVRAAAARTLGRQGSSDGLGPLLELARDADVRVRVNACRALGQIADSTAVPQLLAGLDDPHPYVREVAATALGKLRDRDAVAGLVEAGKDREPAVRGAAVGAIAELVGGADPAQAWALVRPFLSDVHERVRAAAGAALARVRYPEAAAVLRRCLSGEPAEGRAPTPLERASAAAALAELGDSAARPAMIRALDERDAGLVSSVVDALGEMGAGDPAVVPAILAAVRANASPNEPDVVVSGLEALAKLKAAAGVPLAADQLASPHPRVRVAARSLLVAVLGDSAATEVARAHGPPPWRAASLREYRVLPQTARRAVLRTSRGDVVLELFPEDAPRTVANFVRLARRGYYDHLTFHRVVPNFVVQDGDPTGTGWGGPGYAIRCEYNRRRYGFGTVGMALSGKDTGGSQYFITQMPQPHLDGRYTVFGRVVEGLEVVGNLTLGDEIRSVTVGP